MVRILTLMAWVFAGTLASSSAFAEGDTVVSATPFVAFIKPYVDIIVQSLIGFLFVWVASQINKYTGVQISKTSLDKLRDAAASQAGGLVAAAEDNLAGGSIDVHSEGVADAARWILEHLPDAAKEVGATPDVLSRMIVGEIGKLQATATSAPLPPGGAS